MCVAHCDSPAGGVVNGCGGSRWPLGPIVGRGDVATDDVRDGCKVDK